jgi:hypothetical protein
MLLKTYLIKENACKLSLVVDSNDVSHSSLVKISASADSKLFHINLGNLLINSKTNNYSKFNRYKRNMRISTLTKRKI